jgi:hypothetical protein
MAAELQPEEAVVAAMVGVVVGWRRRRSGRKWWSRCESNWAATGGLNTGEKRKIHMPEKCSNFSVNAHYTGEAYGKDEAEAEKNLMQKIEDWIIKHEHLDPKCATRGDCPNDAKGNKQKCHSEIYFLVDESGKDKNFRPDNSKTHKWNPPDFFPKKEEKRVRASWDGVVTLQCQCSERGDGPVQPKAGPGTAPKQAGSDE